MRHSSGGLDGPRAVLVAICIDNRLLPHCFRRETVVFWSYHDGERTTTLAARLQTIIDGSRWCFLSIIFTKERETFASTFRSINMPKYFLLHFLMRKIAAPSLFSVAADFHCPREKKNFVDETSGADFF